jgi:hypothetical protein
LALGAMVTRPDSETAVSGAPRRTGKRQFCLLIDQSRLKQRPKQPALALRPASPSWRRCLFRSRGGHSVALVGLLAGESRNENGSGS